jgi:hypothetical protein
MKRTTKILKDKKSFTIFDWLKEITYNKSPWNSFTDEDKESFNSYMIHRFVSMNPDYIEFTNFIQTIPYTEKEKIYNLYLRMLPKKAVYFKYIKSNHPKKSEAILKQVAKYYECSYKEASDYIDILGKDKVKDILGKLGIEEKEIKSLLKW